LAIQGNSWLLICRRFEISGLCSILNSTAACITAAVAATVAAAAAAAAGGGGGSGPGWLAPITC
jgi:hypothetical protein